MVIVAPSFLDKTITVTGSKVVGSLCSTLTRNLRLFGLGDISILQPLIFATEIATDGNRAVLEIIDPSNDRILKHQVLIHKPQIHTHNLQDRVKQFDPFTVCRTGRVFTHITHIKQKQKMITENILCHPCWGKILQNLQHLVQRWKWTSLTSPGQSGAGRSRHCFVIADCCGVRILDFIFVKLFGPIEPKSLLPQLFNSKVKSLHKLCM